MNIQEIIDENKVFSIKNAELTADLRLVKNNILKLLTIIGIAENNKIDAENIELTNVLGSIVGIGQKAISVNTPWASKKKKEDFVNQFGCIKELMPLLIKYENL